MRIWKVWAICEPRNMRPETMATRGVKLLISSTTFKEALKLPGRLSPTFCFSLCNQWGQKMFREWILIFQRTFFFLQLYNIVVNFEISDERIAGTGIAEHVGMRIWENKICKNVACVEFFKNILSTAVACEISDTEFSRWNFAALTTANHAWDVVFSSLELDICSLFYLNRLRTPTEFDFIFSCQLLPISENLLSYCSKSSTVFNK